MSVKEEAREMKQVGEQRANRGPWLLSCSQRKPFWQRNRCSSPCLNRRWRRREIKICKLPLLVEEAHQVLATEEGKTVTGSGNGFLSILSWIRVVRYGITLEGFLGLWVFCVWGFGFGWV
ncbi:hypothetical protein PIB30_024800 [Stylosanthes scabra]|uniref:Uncharacterized protein n=1 Tax=Stylosanthes scabra TaxID=79078 RepID=A0ABU6W8C7_9FABA|nr:hypothetical protein [Stylosanthes scabra]